MISGMLMRSAAEKFCIAISAWCSGFASSAMRHSARCCTSPALKKSMARPSSSASSRKSEISEATIGTP